MKLNEIFKKCEADIISQLYHSDGKRLYRIVNIKANTTLASNLSLKQAKIELDYERARYGVRLANWFVPDHYEDAMCLPYRQAIPKLIEQARSELKDARETKPKGATHWCCSSKIYYRVTATDVHFNDAEGDWARSAHTPTDITQIFTDMFHPV